MTHREVLDRWPMLRPWFAGFPAELYGAYSVRSFPKGYLIHQKGTVLDRVGILCEGALRVINEFDTGNIYMIEHNQPVDVIGDVTVLARREKASVTIETLVPSTALFFARADFEYWMDHDPHLVREMAQHVADKLYHSSYYRGKELFYSSPRLLMEYILQETEVVPLPHRLAATRQQISETLGMSLKTVDRTVAKLRDQGLISVERGKICVTSQQRQELVLRLEQWLD